MIRKLSAALFAFGLLGAAPAPDWRPLDPENLLVIDTTRGRIIVEMAPEMAPQSVARVKLLAREGVYDGLQFHRVIGRDDVSLDECGDELELGSLPNRDRRTAS